MGYERKIFDSFFPLLGIACLLACLFFAYFLIQNYINWFSLLNWQAVPAVITKAELHSEYYKKDKKLWYSISAEYQYKIANHLYQSSEVLLPSSGRSGSESEFALLVYPDLKNHVENDKLFTAYVNPSNLKESVLYRFVSGTETSLLGFATFIFGFFGFLITSNFLYFKTIKYTNYDLIQKYPQQPWRHKVEWEEKQFKTNEVFFVYLSLITVIFFNLLINLPIFMIGIPNLFIWNNFSSFLLVFSIIFVGLGIFLLVVTLKFLYFYRNFGIVTFNLQKNPILLGEKLQTTLTFPKGLNNDTLFIEIYCTKSASNESPFAILWQNKQQINHLSNLDNQALSIPIMLDLPAELPAINQHENKIAWKFKFTIKKMFSMSHEFDLPVFKP